MRLTRMEQLAREKICLPLDGLATLDDVKARVEELSPVVGLFKVGKESYTRFGPDVVRLVQSFGSNVFLDLKYHDIPNTVRRAADAAAQLGVYMFNVHALGGKDMMAAAREGASDGAAKYNVQTPKVIAVTVLTSIDHRVLVDELKIEKTVTGHVRDLARLAGMAGLDGIVCSADDLQSITYSLPADFIYVTPGIKGPNAQAGSDQKRVVTPGNAIRWGSSILVIGRAITGQPTPEARLQAGHDILKDMVQYVK